MFQMASQLALGLLSTLAFALVTGVNITICDCNTPKAIGLLDAELPSYCQTSVTVQPIIKKYQFFIKEEPHAHWEGYVCRTWIKTKKIVGYFFGAYDTTFTTSSRPVTEKECWEMAQYQRCFENSMEGEVDSFSFTTPPEGEGAWMQIKTYGLINCMLQKITIRKDCLHCPITSPFGLLTNNSGVSFVRHHDSIIVWDASKANISGQCNLKILQLGSGLVYKVDSNSLKLVDSASQLEYFYYENVETICTKSLHKLKNLDSAYLQIIAQDWSHISNVDTKLCLDTNLEEVDCNSQKPQEFILYKNELALNLTHLAVTKKNCLRPMILLGLYNTMGRMRARDKNNIRFFDVISTDCDRKANFRWNSDTMEITAFMPNWREACLTAVVGSQPTLKNCTQEKNQKWIFGLPEIPTKRRMDDSQPLLLQHHQYMERQATVHENVLEKEIKKVYCGNLQVRKYTTMLLAEQNGLLAARANKLPMCQRLKMYGEYFIVQQCTPVNISVGMKQTKCGPEPSYKNFTVGKDGFSLHPFEECFWPNNLVNLNGKPHMWKDGEWSVMQPSIHLSTLRLTSKFEELEDNEAQYLINSHDISTRPEYESINSVNEIVSRIHESNSKSLSVILVNEHEDSRSWSLHGWASKLQTSLITVISAALFSIVIIIIIWKYKSRVIGLREILEHFAMGLQERRRQQANMLTM